MGVAELREKWSSVGPWHENRQYLDRRAGGGLIEVEAPENDDASVYIRLTEPRLRRGRTSLTREHQAVFTLHGLPELGLRSTTR